MSQENMEIIRSIDHQWRTGNFRAAIEFYDPSILFVPLETLPDPEPQQGLENVRQWMRSWLQSWANFTISAEEIIDAGDSVMLAVCQRGEGHESRTPVEIRFFEVWTFRGGRVIRREQFHERAQALEAAGLLA